MKPILINSKKLKDEKILELKNEIESLGRKPKLVIISASDDKASKNYIRNKVKIGAEIGINVSVVEESEDITTQE